MFQSPRNRIDAALAGTHALIDLDAYGYNLRQIGKHISHVDRAELMAVVKANAYGHGSVMCARTALSVGAQILGVARIEEALELRKSGITAPIIVLGPFNTHLVPLAIAENIAIAAGSNDVMFRLLPALELAANNRLHVHLKIDSGMHRYGVLPEDAVAIAKSLNDHSSIELVGLFTHFATADDADDQFLQEQVRRFTRVQHELEQQGITPQYVHVSNSAATLRGVQPTLSGETVPLFRAGIASYGLSPSKEVPVPADFRRVMTIKSRIGRVFTLSPGEGVSYGLTHIADSPTRAGTVPIGYGDGFNRLLSNAGWMAVRGERCPIIGRVCMDQTVINLNNVPEAAEEDEVVVLADGAKQTMTADDAAQIIGTINYEVTTALLPRVPRIYLRGGEPVAILDLAGLGEAQ